jgi:flagellar M-ring protein FliF
VTLSTWWAELGRGARWGLGVGVAAIVFATIALGYWALHTEYEVLFSRLSAQDASSLTHELDQMKIPYRLGEDGTTILVDRATVHQTRLKLMGKDLPLQGAVGFELFNNADFGMTEFAQKVNYQRALQGELTRTILALAEVETARVHLAFPEDGLFKREQGRTKASITLTLREGKALRREQVRGIQRLVAAAVQGVEAKDVTIINDQGVALTSDSDDVAGGVASSARVDVKRELEQYLVQKANAVLDKAFGPGQAMASVDATLDMNQVRTTTEDVLTPPFAAGEGPVGVVLRERETSRESARGGSAIGGEASGPGNTQREVDYQLGRRVEQVVSSPGAISKLQVVAVLRSPLSAAQVEQVRQLIGSAVGAVRERGDVVVVHALEGLAVNALTPASAPAAVAEAGGTNPAPPPAKATATDRDSPVQGVAIVLVGVMLVAMGAFWAMGRRGATAPQRPMTREQREASLAQVRAWLSEPEADRSAGGVR